MSSEKLSMLSVETPVSSSRPPTRESQPDRWLSREEYLAWVRQAKYTATEIREGKAPAVPGPYPAKVREWLEEASKVEAK